MAIKHQNATFGEGLSKTSLAELAIIGGVQILAEDSKTITPREKEVWQLGELERYLSETNPRFKR